MLISTHTPLAGRDVYGNAKVSGNAISTHTPLAGRDRKGEMKMQGLQDFYSHAPRGT